MALPAGVRKPRRRPGRRLPYFRPGVCVRKPSSLALPAGVRKPRRRPGRRFPYFRPGGLRTETEFIGFPGRRTQTAPASGPPFSIFQARGFAYGNRVHWLCGPAYENRAGVRAASNTEKSDARSAVAFEHHFSLFLYTILPIALPPPQHREVHLKKTTYFFNTAPFPEPLFKKSVIFLNSQDWIRKLPSFLPSSQRSLCNSISTNV